MSMKQIVIAIILGTTLVYIFVPRKLVPRLVEENAEEQEESVKMENHVVNSRIIYSYMDLESQLCLEETDWTNKSFYRPEKGPCPKKGLVSVISGGRTGNQMWEYASVWAVARVTKLDPYMPRCIISKLEQVFEKMDIPDFANIHHCPVELNTFVTSMYDWKSTNQNIIMPRFTAQPHLVLKSVSDVVKQFRFKPEIAEKAKRTLEEVVEKLPPKKYTFVAVHVRRTDYVGLLKKMYGTTLVDPSFFVHAMDYFRQRYPDCLFIYVSDDPSWCKENLGQVEDVFVVSNSDNTAAVDLAIMASCNHSIIDYGTFGEWGAILAGGETIYSNLSKNVWKGKYMKNWSVIN